jgi:hypothetical protein
MVISAPFSSRIGSLTGPTVGRKKHRRSDSAAKLQKNIPNVNIANLNTSAN